MNVSVFGLGYVGAVTAGCLAKNGHRVIGVDPDERKLEMIEAGRAPIIEDGVDDLISGAVESGRLTVSSCANEAIAATDISLVCVGTPSTSDGGILLHHVERVSEQIGAAIAAKNSFHSVVVRSTVIPGTTANVVRPILERTTNGTLGETFGLTMNPEFLREGTSIADFYDPPFTVIGSWDDEETARVSGLYEGVSGEIHACSTSAAEAMKYACNLYHAAKITFANEIGMLCHSLDVDAREVMELACKDTKLNISARYMRPGFAFGGSCLPKDLRAFSYAGKMNSVTMPMFDGILRSNREQVETAARRVMALGKRRIAMLGISFKEGTDDLRESPLVSLAEILIGRGYEVVIHDPNVEYASLHGANKRFIDRELPHLKSALVSAEVAQRHAEVIVVGHATEQYEKMAAEATAEQHVIDLVGLRNAGDSAAAIEGLYW